MSAPEPSDLGRFEPTPYDLGITDNPEASRADVQPGAEVMTGECPGVDTRGHGLTMSEIHAGKCCERWEARHSEPQAEVSEPEPEAEP